MELPLRLRKKKREGEKYPSIDVDTTRIIGRLAKHNARWKGKGIVSTGRKRISRYKTPWYDSLDIIFLYPHSWDPPKFNLSSCVRFSYPSLLWPQIESHAGSNTQRRGETPLIFDSEEGKRTERSKDEVGVVCSYLYSMTWCGFPALVFGRKKFIRWWNSLMAWTQSTFRTDRKLRLKIPVSHFGHATYENETDRIMQLQPCEWTR